MAHAERRATARWEGSLTKGSGTISFDSSGAPDQPVTWPSRVESPDGRTSPEELIAAAHASCFAMAFSATLGRQASAPDRLEVTATVSLDPKEGGGFQVTGSALVVTGTVSDIDQATFQQLAEAAEQGCPISNALRGNVPISVTATLA